MSQSKTIALDFLRGVFAGQDGFVSVSAILPDGPITTRSVRPDDVGGLASFIAENNGRANLYWSVNPVRTKLDKKATKSDIAAMAYLHVDIDPRTGFPLEDERARIHALIEKFPGPKPNIVIDSGGGYQCFWRMREPIYANGNIAHLESYNRRIQQALGADDCWNIDRIMRLPGTLNLPTAKKIAKGRSANPVLTAVVYQDDGSYRLEDFDSLPAFKATERPRVQLEADAEIPARFRDMLETDQVLRRRWEGSTEGLNDTTRSGMDYSMTRLLGHRGFNPAEIAVILRVFPHGKAAELGDEYIARMLDPDEPGLTPKERIARIRKSKADVSDKRRRISGIVLDELRRDGAFYRTPLELYYFDRADASLLLIEAVDFRARINERFGVNGSEPDWAFILEDVRAEVLLHGVTATVHRFAHYQDGQHYLYAGENRIFRTTAEGTQEVPNGTDGVLFLNPQIEPVQKPQAKPTGRALLRVLRMPRFKGAHNLRPAQERKLYAIWAVALLFPALLPTKPLLLLYGPKGSGKTAALKALLRALFGRAASVFTLSKDKEDAFLAAITNNHVLALDNVDGYVKWLPDHLAVAATGGTLPLRRLYTTNELVEFPVECFLGMTSREPDSFTRDDIADRLLVLAVDRFSCFTPERELMKEIDELRPAIWAELLEIVRRVLVALHDHEAVQTKHRLADFADLALLIGPALGIRRERVLEMLDCMDAEKVEFAVEHDQLAQALIKWLAVAAAGEWISTGELFKQMEAAWQGDRFPVTNAVALGRKLPKRRGDFAGYINIEGPRTGANNTKLWRITAGSQLKIEAARDAF